MVQFIIDVIDNNKHGLSIIQSCDTKKSEGIPSEQLVWGHDGTSWRKVSSSALELPWKLACMILTATALPLHRPADIHGVAGSDLLIKI